MKRLVMACALAGGALSMPTHAEPRTAFVHLFEWQWNDIASECENVLGPKGYSAVQVSPPQKSINGSQWWTRYQPVSYAIEGRSGSRDEFASMVKRCKAVGVDIYADAVINHMAAWDRDFPEVPFSQWDFHDCTGGINYQDRWQVQNCDLVSLNDLATEKDYVQGKIADYMNDLTSLGVAGFRIDAAKHMPAGDIAAIKSRLNGNPYIYQEVIGADNEPVKPSEYTGIGDVTEFNFTKTIGYYFKRRGALKELKNIGSWSNWLSSDKAITFVANHDNQRQDTDNTITHKDGNNANNLAHIFTLAWPYGYPKVMSSYDWSDHDQGPPGHGASSCSGGWLCEHRNREIANMVSFRNHTAAQFRATHQWDNGGNQIAFGRGGLGFVVINMDGNLNRNFQTGMPKGVYCDVIAGDYNAASRSCSGRTITVDDNGFANFEVYYNNAAAIHVGAIVGAGGNSGGGDNSGGSNGGDNGSGTGTVNTTLTCANGNTTLGQSVYVVGNRAELGNWSPASAVKLDPASYPIWTGTIALPQNTAIEWKCLKRNESNPGNDLVWQNGDNNIFNTGANNSQISASF
ncbi:carbohydrate-binding module family 20 domain-containing protein [Marinagarivorans algicola]|uniref:carbohydrate-binding module family 20 domain-containing protein n=1 Tax=Marinagarivorans algicola TaxID=1513270 RepID=UPI0006B8F31F|nr:carbohydrate-binding module family 20 domain-containing protein [Marinagarivorans algicola]